MTVRTYATPEAFRVALEANLRKSSKGSGAAFSRRRQLLVFDRFLARVSTHFADAVILKGGLALELRLERARTTRDVDLRVMGRSAEGLLAELQTCGQMALGDHLLFEIQMDRSHPEIAGEGVEYEGKRFRVVCQLGGRPLADPFGVDVVIAGAIHGEPDIFTAEDHLDFIGIPPPTLRVLPVGTHIAEKLHAYTLPRTRPNTRVKDLPDLALLAAAQAHEASALRAALERTFNARGTHPLPTSVPLPPKEWSAEYKRIAEENELPWGAIDAAVEVARAFLDPVLREDFAATWSVSTLTWVPTND